MENQKRKGKPSIEKTPCRFAFKISFPVRYFDSFLIFRAASFKRFFFFKKKKRKKERKKEKKKKRKKMFTHVLFLPNLIQ